MDPSALWALASPFDAAAVGVAVLAECVWLAAVRATVNLRTLGPAWPFAYWLAVAGLFHLGLSGWAQLRHVRRGNDHWEFDPERRGGDWAGRAGIAGVRWQIRFDLFRAGWSTMVGFGGSFALIVVGVLWTWLLTIGAAVVLAAAVRARWLGRTAPWERP